MVKNSPHLKHLVLSKNRFSNPHFFSMRCSYHEQGGHEDHFDLDTLDLSENFITLNASNFIEETYLLQNPDQDERIKDLKKVRPIPISLKTLKLIPTKDVHDEYSTYDQEILDTINVCKNLTPPLTTKIIYKREDLP